jgi:tRNA(Ile)-lysidine synthase TilS/MesJ
VRIKNLISELEKEIPHVRASMLNALGNTTPSHLLDHVLFDFKSLGMTSGDIEAELDLALGHVEEGTTIEERTSQEEGLGPARPSQATAGASPSS